MRAYRNCFDNNLVVEVPLPKGCPSDAERMYNYRANGEYEQSDRIRAYYEKMGRKVLMGNGYVVIQDSNGTPLWGFGTEEAIAVYENKRKKIALEFLSKHKWVSPGMKKQYQDKLNALR